MKTTIKAEFYIWGNDVKFLPNTVTEMLDITPTETYKQDDDIYHKKLDGSVIKNPSVKRKETCWRYGKDWVVSDNVMDVVNELFPKLCDKVDIILHIQELYKVKVSFMIAVSMPEEDRRIPSLDLSREFVSFAGRINADIRFDINM